MGGAVAISGKAFDFYKELEANNTREWWHAHKEEYDTSVREPLQELIDELEAEFGPGKLFRPQRDTRFSTDKSPYKTNQSATVGEGGRVGYYLQLQADGLYVGAGFHAFESDDTARYRQAVDDEKAGEELVKIVKKLKKEGFALVGEQVKTQPRGYPADHPRIELLRYKSLGAEHRVPKSKTTVTAVRDDWRRLRPLVDWMRARLS